MKKYWESIEAPLFLLIDIYVSVIWRKADFDAVVHGMV